MDARHWLLTCLMSRWHIEYSSIIQCRSIYIVNLESHNIQHDSDGFSWTRMAFLNRIIIYWDIERDKCSYIAEKRAMPSSDGQEEYISILVLVRASFTAHGCLHTLQWKNTNNIGIIYAIEASLGVRYCVCVSTTIRQRCDSLTLSSGSGALWINTRSRISIYTILSLPSTFDICAMNTYNKCGRLCYICGNHVTVYNPEA